MWQSSGHSFVPSLIRKSLSSNAFSRMDKKAPLFARSKNASLAGQLGEPFSKGVELRYQEIKFSISSVNYNNNKIGVQNSQTQNSAYVFVVS